MEKTLLNTNHLKVQFKYLPNQRMGRFGGGWNWKLGFQIGGSSLIINLLVCFIRVDYIKMAKQL